jgi:glycosyltransferase involved in cell wall biosynthesis
MAERLLSLVLPAYKQEKTIVEDIKNLSKVLSTLTVSYELIVVVDGFLDKTYEKAKKLENRAISKKQKAPSKNHKSEIINLKSGTLRVFGYEKNQGKGYAIKYGVSEAKGDIIGYIDAGMDLDPKEISLMLDIFDWNNADIIIGSKLHPDSKVTYPRSRRILSWGYRTITRLLFDLNVKDTQVGLKLYRRKVAKSVFPKIIIKRFAFDVEVLAVARLYGFTKIYEAPVKLKFRPGSITTVNFFKISFSMLVDTLAIFYRMNIIHYYDKDKDKDKKQRAMNK